MRMDVNEMSNSCGTIVGKTGFLRQKGGVNVEERERRRKRKTQERPKE